MSHKEKGQKMRNYNLSEVRDFIFDYNLIDRSIGYVLFETAIVAFLIGSDTQNIGWGVGSFIIMMFLYGIPLIGGIFAFVFSFVESIIIGGILSLLGASLGWVYFIGAIAFVVLTNMHKAFGGLDNPALLGYSLIIFYDLLLSGIVYLEFQRVSFAIVTFIVVLVVAFIPVARILELVALCGSVSLFAYGASCDSLGIWKAVMFAAFVFVYSGILFICAYMGVDYVGMAKSKKERKIQEENANRDYQIKMELYNRYPELEPNYYYFYNQVCKSELDKVKFDIDWSKYLEYLHTTSTIISFNEYFGQEKLYRTSKYNSDFARQHAEWNGENSKQKPKEEVKFEGQNSNYFAGINDLESLKKRYHALLKIYHPDNQNGDVSISKQIQAEYEQLLKKYESV